MEELLIAVKKENETLKTKNHTLYRKSKNLERSNLRLKKIIEKQNDFLKKIKQNQILDSEWEDLDILVKDSDTNDQ